MRESRSMANDKLSESDKEIATYVNSMDKYKNAASELSDLRKSLIIDFNEISDKIDKLRNVQSDIQVLLKTTDSVVVEKSEPTATDVDKVLVVNDALDSPENPQEPTLEPVEVSKDDSATSTAKAVKKAKPKAKASEAANPSLIAADEDEGGFPDFDEDDYLMSNEVSEEDNNLSKTDNVDNIQF